MAIVSSSTLVDGGLQVPFAQISELFDVDCSLQEHQPRSTKPEELLSSFFQLEVEDEEQEQRWLLLENEPGHFILLLYIELPVLAGWYAGQQHDA